MSELEHLGEAVAEVLADADLNDSERRRVLLAVAWAEKGLDREAAVRAGVLTDTALQIAASAAAQDLRPRAAAAYHAAAVEAVGTRMDELVAGLEVDALGLVAEIEQRAGAQLED